MNALEPKIERTFLNLEDAMKFISNYIPCQYGEEIPTEVEDGRAIIKLETNYDSIKYYKLENEQRINYATLYSFNNQYIVHIWIIHKHPMVSAAKRDNLQQFLKHFRDDEIKINLSFEISLRYGSKSIYKWLIQNTRITNDPIYRAILYDSADALDLLLSNNYTMKSNWLVQSVEYGAKKIIEEFLYKRKYKVQDLDSSYFRKRVIYTDYPDREKLIEFITINYGYKG